MYERMRQTGREANARTGVVRRTETEITTDNWGTSAHMNPQVALPEAQRSARTALGAVGRRFESARPDEQRKGSHPLKNSVSEGRHTALTPG